LPGYHIAYQKLCYDVVKIGIFSGEFIIRGLDMEPMMKSSNIQDYLRATMEIDFHKSEIQQQAADLFNSADSDIEKAKAAFHFVRDEIAHSWDIQGKRVTKTASEVLAAGEGICYAKSNLLAALLRSEGIPAGFRYQRLMLFDTPDKGYCIHAFNAVFLESVNRWISLDARGNKTGIDAQFSLEEPLALAFHPDEALGECTYSGLYPDPHPKTMAVLARHDNALDMYVKDLPDSL